MRFAFYAFNNHIMVVTGKKGEIERRLTPRYPQLWLNIGKSSQTALDVSGARSDKEKSDIMNTLEAIWQDDTWLPE